MDEGLIEEEEIYSKELPAKERFKIICEEFNGEYEEKYGSLFCKIDDYESYHPEEDIETVARWVEDHREKLKDEDIVIEGEWSYEGETTYEASIEYPVDSEKARIEIKEKRYIDNLGLLDWAEEEYGVEPDLEEIEENTSKEVDELNNKLQESKDIIEKNTSCYLDYDGGNYYGVCRTEFELPSGRYMFSKVIEDLDNFTGQVSDIFYNELDKEVEKKRGD